MKHIRIIASLIFLICFSFFHKGVSAEITAGAYTLSPHAGGYEFAHVRGGTIDSDNDGVYDDIDHCPDTPSGAPVDNEGCPLDSDGDGDGVYDQMDKCPDTPAGAPVDSKGCPLDSDRDGVYDYMDRCPGTLAGVKVDTNGCPIPVKEKVSIQLNIEFDTDKALIRSVYHEQLKEVADFLKKYPETTAVIEGHTDNMGATEYNLALSTKRADAVRKYIIDKFDIASQRLTAKGYGESVPIADNNTKEGRQKNRRVLAVFSGMAIKK